MADLGGKCSETGVNDDAYGLWQNPTCNPGLA
jgi:hypothetical protein